MMRVQIARPLEWRLVHRIIETSWLWHYSQFMPRGALLPYAGKRLQRVIAKRVMSPSSQAFLAYDGSRRPSAAMTIIRTPDSIEVDDLFVLPGRTSRGLGGLLLTTARTEARQRGKPLVLWAMRNNARARRFYEREGGHLFAFGSYSWGRGRHPSVAYRWRNP
jgi:ribosomal protein S18 acetylase RimI-like enzyme